MGGGLQFLNKKSWHTGGMKQIEKVWKREQEHAEEKAKVAELKKQIEEEREQLSLQRLAEDGGHQKKKVERVDWLYNTPLANREAFETTQEAALLDKKVDLSKDDVKQAEASQSERAVHLPSVSRSETWVRMNEDPLFAIKQQQQQSLSKIRKNPVQMQAIRREVKAVRGKIMSEGSGDEIGEKSRHHRSRRRYHRSHKSSSSGHRSSRRRGRDRERGEKKREGERERSRSLSPRRSARDHGGQYGLAASEKTGISGTSQHSKGKFNARERIMQAEREQKRERQEKERSRKAWSYGGKTKHKVGKVDDREKERRLAEMMRNAQDHGQVRRDETRRQEEEEKRKDEEAKASSGKDTFLDAFNKNIYGASSSGGLSLEEAVGRRKFYSERGGGRSSNGFRK